jgi:HAD superfamily hydrolase (TIGR01509 family)
MVDLVIFDCDGVLIDSEVIAGRVHAAELAACGFGVTASEIVARFIGVRDRDMYEVLEREHGKALPPGYNTRVKMRIAELYRTELRAIAGVAEALAAIRLPVCVASSSAPETLRLGLGLVGLWERFAPHVFSARQVARGKPAPDLFLLAAERMGVAAGRCLVIEDSIAGVTAARAAGMRSFGFCGGAHCGAGHDDRLRDAGALLAFTEMVRLPALIAALPARA